MSTYQEDREALAVIIAYTEDDYLREQGTLNGAAQAVADAILAAGYRKPPSREEVMKVIYEALAARLRMVYLTTPATRGMDSTRWVAVAEAVEREGYRKPPSREEVMKVIYEAAGLAYWGGAVVAYEAADAVLALWKEEA